MDLMISIGGLDPVTETTELSRWLHNGRLVGVQRVLQQDAPPNPGEQGPMLLASLAVILNSDAVIELVKSVHRFIEARRPKTKITIKEGGRELIIDCVNPPPLSELIEQAKAAFDE